MEKPGSFFCLWGEKKCRFYKHSRFVCRVVPYSGWMRLVNEDVCTRVRALLVQRWTWRASGGDREEESGWGGATWASDFPDEIQYVRRCILKRHFLMGPPHEYKFPPPPLSELEGRTHLASTHSGEVQRFLFFYHNIYFHPITEKKWGDFTAAPYESSIHTFV